MNAVAALSPPALRPREGRNGNSGTVMLPLPGPSMENKFSMTWTSDSGQTVSFPAPDCVRQSPKASTASLEEEEDDVMLQDNDKTPEDPKTPTRPSRAPAIPSSSHPPLPRAFSMPLPSQLENPHRKSELSVPMDPHASQPSTPEVAQFRELALELADSVQMVIQTLVQISPSQILDPAKEQVSPFALSIPTPSMSAMFTAMKNINYISANMTTFSSSYREEESPFVQNDFDIGELLQSSGDALSGAAATAGVELVLYHGDVDLKHMWVKGDESGISYALLHIVRQILRTSHPGDSLEIGLLVSSDPAPPRSASSSSLSEGSMGSISPPLALGSNLHCAIEITHNFTAFHDAEEATLRRPSPSFSVPLLPRLLAKAGAKLDTRMPASESRRTCVLSFVLSRGFAPPASPPADERSTVEPSMNALKHFSEELRGKKATLYASSSGAFARHLTSYLTAWGMDVSHVSDGMPDGQGEAVTSPTSILKDSDSGEDARKSSATPQPRIPPPPQDVSFIFVDDDVMVLGERLRTLRRDVMPAPSLTRPPLLHRTVSTSHVARANGVPISEFPSGSAAVIVHFTSLSNFKSVKSVVSSVVTAQTGVFPEIMIIPKPAGPRRLLTALHTAITKPAVDPSFSPIVTSPGAAGLNSNTGSFFPPQTSATSTPTKSSPLPHRPSGSRSNSDGSVRSIHSVIDSASRIPPSPLGVVDQEFFTPTAVKLEEKKKVGSNLSAGVMVEVTKGQPEGLYFQVDRSSKAGSVRPQMSRSMSKGLRSTSSSGPQEFLRRPPMRKRQTSNSSSGLSSPVREVQKSPSLVPPISVLIVEDNPINQTILSVFMRKKHIKYDVANDGKTAVEKWKTGDFHLILMDIQMPIMDGKKATSIIRQIEAERDSLMKETDDLLYGTPSSQRSSTPGAQPPTPYRPHVIILALTASSWQEDRVSALAAGCDDFLTKPISMSWLEKKLLEWGSMQALRMWGTPEPVRTSEEVMAAAAIRSQVANAQTVANALTLPPKARSRSRTPSPGRSAPPVTAASSTFWSDGPETPFIPAKPARKDSGDDSTPGARPNRGPNGFSHGHLHANMDENPSPPTLH